MKFTAKDFNTLSPTDRMKRTTINNTSLCIEQKQKGFSVLFNYRSPVTHKKRLMKIKSYNYGIITKGDIKFLADKQLMLENEVSIKGLDPMQQSESTNIITVGALWAEITASSKFTKLADNTQNIYIATYNRHIGPKYGRGAPDYTRANIEAFLDTLTKAVALLALSVLLKIEKQALAHEIITANRLTGVELQKPNVRDYHLGDDDIRTLFAYLDSADLWPSVENSIRMQLLTGCRISEITKSQWEHVDLDNMTFTIPPENIKTERAYKNGNRPHVLPITKPMLELINKQRGLHYKWIFASNRNNATDSNAMRIVLKKAGMPHNGTHLLRKTVGTNIFKLYNDETPVKIILNHSRVSGSTVSYVDSSEQQLDKKREILTRWHDHLSALIA